ncbi:MAG: glyoxalase/bleomycin resistance/dioxygenase family protein [Actinomycetota bacterium]|nr:glyoxalase/bleomycin resistance/dioxygenase family protein [Actinomycetota bacterium]
MAKLRPGYANFALDDPPLKLVLIENPGRGGSLNHLGVEVPTTDEVAAATQRLADAGLDTVVEDGTTCCYAVQDKVWVTALGQQRWEIYTVVADAGVDLAGEAQDAPGPVSAGGCGTGCCAVT